MNQKTLMIVVITAVITLVIAPKLRQLPVIGKLPTA